MHHAERSSIHASSSEAARGDGERSRTSAVAARRAAMCMVMGAALLGAWWRLAGRPGSWAHPKSAHAVTDQLPGRAEQTARIEAALAEADRRAGLAVDAAVARVRARFAEHRAGVPGFCEEVTGWGVRVRVTALSVGDAWRRARVSLGIDQRRPESVGAVERDIAARFTRRVLPNGAVESAVSDALAALDDELAAIRAEAWSRVDLALSADEGRARADARPRAPERMLEVASPRLARGAVDAATDGAATLIAGSFAAALGEQAAAQVGGRVLTLLAGGATAAGMSVGGAGGALGGPAGVATGLAAGVAVGAAVDWWLTDAFRARLKAEIDASLDAAEEAVIEGDPEPLDPAVIDAGHRWTGVRALASDAARAQSKAMRAAAVARLRAEGAS